MSKQQKKWADYFCHNCRVGRCDHNPGYIHQGKADEIVLAQFQAMYGNEAARDERLLQAAQKLEVDMAGLKGQRSVLAGQLAALDEQEGRVMRAARAGEIDFKELRDLRLGIERDRKDLRDRTSELDQHISQIGGRVQEMQMVIQRFSAVERVDLMSTEQKRDLLRMALAGPIILFKQKGTDLIEVDIPWAY